MESKAKIDSLVKKAQLGDKKALSKLYDMYYDKVFYFVYSRINNYSDAKDIVAGAFLSLVESLPKYQFKSSFKNYLFGIVKNKMYDYIRAKYHGSSYVLETNLLQNYFDNVAAEDEKQGVERSAYKNKLRSMLKTILQSMKPKYAKVLDLRFNKMNSVQEAANIMNVSANNLKVLQHRAIKQARSIWNNLPQDEREKRLGK